jgi:RNA polymerase sigma factor (sigma-70 family)
MSWITRSAVLRSVYKLFEEGTLSGLNDEQLLERFVAKRDEAAFEALVVRHGRSVLAVCHDVLRDGHDAEDAFQATFLILARKAGGLWVRGSLAAWLHRVARRVSVEANLQMARRKRFEKTGADIDVAGTTSRRPEADLLAIMHEEIDRLPLKYRSPIILCELECLTRNEAACRLGLQPGTVAGRLARARSILRDRIVRRTNVEEGRLAALGAICSATMPEVPSSFITKAVKLPTTWPTGMSLKSGIDSVRAVRLAQRTSTAMLLTKFNCTAAMSIAAGFALVAVFVGFARVRPASTAFAEAGAAVVSEQARAESTSRPPDVRLTTVLLAGTVVLQDGSPAVGAHVFMSTVTHAYARGEIRAGTIVAKNGEFHFDVPKVDVPWAGMIGTGTLWAYKPGHLVSSTPVYKGALPSDLPQRLVLGPPTRAQFQIRRPDGTAVAGAMVEPRALARNHAEVPDRLSSMIGAESITDAHGRALVTAFFPEEITGIRVTAQGFGQQEFLFESRQTNIETHVIRLLPVGGLKGRLVGQLDAIRLRPLYVVDLSARDEAWQYSYKCVISTDENGRFEIPKLAVGSYGLSTVPRFDFAWWAGTDGLNDVAAGKTSEVVLTLKLAVKVRGFVREEGTGKPVAGVEVAVALAETGAMTSGRDGNYEGYAPPGASLILARYIPAEYARPLDGLPVLIPEGAAEFALPDFELIKAGPVPGLVVDERARTAAGAEVEASWTGETRVGTYRHRLSVRTGPDGRFVFQGVPLGAELLLSARRRGLRTLEPTPAHVREATILRLSPSNCVAMEGRVLDASGKPLGRANVHLRTRNRTTTFGQANDEELVELEGGFVLVTDLEGRFRTPAELELDRAYMAYAHANGHRFNRTGWTTGQSRSFPDMKLQADFPTP